MNYFARLSMAAAALLALAAPAQAAVGDEVALPIEAEAAVPPGDDRGSVRGRCRRRRRGSSRVLCGRRRLRNLPTGGTQSEIFCHQPDHHQRSGTNRKSASRCGRGRSADVPVQFRHALLHRRSRRCGKAAREQAIAKARKDADDYAASLGYHVVRMTRVSNASPSLGMRDLHSIVGYANTAPSRLNPSYFGSATYATVGIDFVIVPN